MVPSSSSDNLLMTSNWSLKSESLKVMSFMLLWAGTLSAIRGSEEQQQFIFSYESPINPRAFSACLDKRVRWPSHRNTNPSLTRFRAFFLRRPTPVITNKTITLQQMSSNFPPLSRDAPNASKRLPKESHFAGHSPRPRISLPMENMLSDSHAGKLDRSMEIKRNHTQHEAQISQDLMGILREENTNLKQQNAFLLSRLRAVSHKEQEARESVKKNEAWAAKLRKQNNDLKKQIQYVHDLTNDKVEEFGKKLLELSDLQPSSSHRIEEYLPVMTPASNNSLENKISKKSIESTTRSVDELNIEFQALLFSCKAEQDPAKKKEYRKKLVELTNRMRESHR